MLSYRPILLLAVIMMLLAACAPNFPTSQPQAEAPEQGVTEPAGSPEISAPTEPSLAADTPTDTGVPANEPAASALPTDTQAPVPTANEAAEACPFRPELHATNPETVALASGEIQLVEFFAFW